MQYRLGRSSFVGTGVWNLEKQTGVPNRRASHLFAADSSDLGQLWPCAIVWGLRIMPGEVTRTQIAPAGPGATLLYDDWYPALRSSKIAGEHMATAMLLGIPLVLGRTAAGRYFAMRDTCPPRGIPLSYGWFDGRQVTCKYHGWSFEAVSGQCCEIPSLTSHNSLDPTRICAAAFPCEERDGHVWVYVPQPGRGKQI